MAKKTSGKKKPARKSVRRPVRKVKPVYRKLAPRKLSQEPAATKAFDSVIGSINSELEHVESLCCRLNDCMMRLSGESTAIKGDAPKPAEHTHLQRLTAMQMRVSDVISNLQCSVNELEKLV